MPFNVDTTKARAVGPEAGALDLVARHAETADEALDVVTNLAVPPPFRASDVTLRRQLEAALELENVVVSAYGRLSGPGSGPATLHFDPREHLQPGEELRVEQFAQADSLQEMAAIRERVKRELEAKQALGEGPLPEMAAIALAVLADPTSYIPVFGPIGKAGTAVKVLRTAVATAGEVALSEAALQASQETRTLEESAAAILTGAVFGGVVGGVSGALGARSAARIADRAREDTVALARAEPISVQPQPVGAASARLDPEDTKLSGSFKLGEVIARLGKRGIAAPSLELLASKFPASREAALMLTDPGLVTRGQVRGHANPQALEVRIRRHDASAKDLAEGLRAGYRLHQNLSRAAGRRPLSRNEFYNAVGRAARRGDTDFGVPGAGQTAKEYRSKIVDPYAKAARAEGLLPEKLDVKTAVSYFTRVYRRDIIRAKRHEFKQVIEGWLSRTIKDRNLEAEAEIGQIADGIIDTIMGNPAGRVHLLNIPRVRGPLKERTFNIPDELIEGFLESNALEVGLRYIRTMAADVETQRMFGTTDPAAEMGKRIQDEANEMMADSSISERQRVRIGEDARKEQRLVTELLNLIRGTVNVPTDPRMAGLQQLGSIARNYNFMRLLGGVTISSLPDLGQLIMREGLARVLGGVFTDAFRGFKGVRMAKTEAQLAGTALDLYMNQRVRALLDIGERHIVGGQLERAHRMSQGAATLFARATLINHWNTAMKSVTSMMASSRILRTSQRLAAGEKVSAGDLKRLAASGIDAGMTQRIAAEASHWSEHGPILTANTAAWKDAGAVDVFRNALLRDVDNTIITPFAGDAPIWTSKEWGKTVFQFKKFASASTQRVLLTALQTRDMATLNGILAMVGMGFLATVLRDYISNGEVRERDARQWAVDSVDRSGVLSMFYEFDAIAEKVAGVSPITAFSGQEVSRFAGREALGQVLGPTAGLFQGTADALSGASQGEFTRSDLHKLRKLIPAQNLFYTRWMLDELEKASGLPDRARSGHGKVATTAPAVIE